MLRLWALLFFSLCHTASAESGIFTPNSCDDASIPAYKECLAKETKTLSDMHVRVLESYVDETQRSDILNQNQKAKVLSLLGASQQKFNAYSSNITDLEWNMGTGTIRSLNVVALQHRMALEYLYHLLNLRCGNRYDVYSVVHYDLSQPNSWCADSSDQ